MIIEIVPVSEQRKHLCIVLFKRKAFLNVLLERFGRPLAESGRFLGIDPVADCNAAVTENFSVTESLSSSPSVKMFLRCREILSVVQSNSSDMAFCVSQNVSSLNITLTNSLPFSSLYSRISPRLAISLLILIFLLIPFRQSCRIGYNVRDLLSKNIGVLRCNHRTACFSFSCCSSHATRIF